MAACRRVSLACRARPTTTPEKTSDGWTIVSERCVEALSRP